MTGVSKLPAGLARCAGRTPTHPYAKECAACLRKLAPPHERQVHMAPWENAHGPCPDKLAAAAAPQ